MEKAGSIIIYQLTGLSQIYRDKLCRKLLGRTVKTHKGKYTHRVKGLLDTVPHIYIGRGALIINKTDEKKLSNFFKDHGVKEVFIRDVILIKEDIDKLNDN
jgi:hypothetical protein